MTRPNWVNLNGSWDYAITAEQQQPARFDGKIVVPFPVESALSGVQRRLCPADILWYRRFFQANTNPNTRTLLHFEAVDFECSVFLNGACVGGHRGGYQRFSFDITEALTDGRNEIVVKVYDPSDRGSNPFGKQFLEPSLVFYQASSGIWQTVWLEQVPNSSIASVKVTPDVKSSGFAIEVAVAGDPTGCELRIIARGAGAIAGQACTGLSGFVKIEEPRLWSPADPFLYDFELALISNGITIDRVESYGGLRQIDVAEDEAGVSRICLNGLPVYNLCVVDQGFWPDGLYTAPCDAALRFDVLAAKALGFNTVRKHIKVENARWYMHCDQLGVLVWQDMPSGNNDTAEGRKQFEDEVRANLFQLHNHPSIISWVLFNEGWGAYDQDRLTLWIGDLDPSRLINGHSGPYDQLTLSMIGRERDARYLPGPFAEGRTAYKEQLQRTQFDAQWTPGQIADLHFYPGPEMLPAQRGVASVTGECGSFGAYVAGHVWNELDQRGFGVGVSNLALHELAPQYAAMINRLVDLKCQGQSGAAYFQLYDVEQEHQGLLTYDRHCLKLPREFLRGLHATLVPVAAMPTSETFEIEEIPLDYESRRFERMLAAWSDRGDAQLLEPLTLASLRQGDELLAKNLVEKFIESCSRPFSRRTWELIAAFASSPDDRAFALLAREASTANEALGPGAAERRLVDVIIRRIVRPRLRSLAPAHRAQFEAELVAEFAALGQEAFDGEVMMSALAEKDWMAFGAAFVRYFRVAAHRSLYPVQVLAHHVLERVDDASAITVAIAATRVDLRTRKEVCFFGQEDPAQLDTLAGLLAKAGQLDEAKDVQERAVGLSEARNSTLVARLNALKSPVRGMR